MVVGEVEADRSVTPPFFILCVDRSGSTLLAAMLDAHPGISVLLESSWFYQHAPRIEDWAAHAPEIRDLKIAAYLEGIAEDDPLYELIRSQSDLAASVSRSNGDATRLLEELCREWTIDRKGKQGIWGEKSCLHAIYIDKIHRSFPAAKYIHLIRDPRATVWSLSKPAFVSKSDRIDVNAHYWRTMNDSISEGLASIPSARKLRVHYEDLVTSPDEATSHLCGFLGVSFDPIMLEHSKFEKRIPKGRGSPAANKPVDTTFLEEWKSALSPAQVACIESVALRGSVERRYLPGSEQHLNPVARLAISGYMNVMHYLLRLVEIGIGRMRGRPLVWTRFRNMARRYWPSWKRDTG